MFIELSDILLFSIICTIILYWVSAQKIREVALAAATKECERLNLQLLDGSVALKKIAPKRNDRGQFVLLRAYRFEFSATGDERYHGMVTMFGKKISDIHLQPHRIL